MLGMADPSGDYLATVTGRFPEARIKSLGITDPLLSTYRASWNSQAPDWQTEMGALFLSQPDDWVLAQLTAMPAPLAVKAIGYVGPNAPALPKFDTMWYDDQHETWKRWNGVIWVSQTGASSGVATVNGQAGTVTITAAGLGAIPTSSLGVTGGVATLDSTGKIPAAQARVASVAGKTGTVTLVVADVAGAISTASINTSGGVAGLDATGHLPIGIMPAGYSSGGGGGGAVASVAGKTGVVTLSVADVANAAQIDPTTSKLLITQLPQRFAATFTQPGTAQLGVINSGGTPIPYDTTTAFVIVTCSRPPVGSAGTVTVRWRTHSSQAINTLASVSIPPFTRRVVVPVVQPLNNGDTLISAVTAVGSTLPGGDYTAQIVGTGAEAQPTFLTAPGNPSSLTVTGAGASRSLAWAAPTSGGPVSIYHIYRSDATHPLAWLADVESPILTYTDSTAVSGVNYGYQIMASNDDFASNLVSSQAYVYFSQADGAPVGWTVALGTNPSTTGSVVGNSFNATSGNVGNGAAQDRVWFGWTDPGTTFSALRWSFPIIWMDSRDIFDIYLNANVLTGPTSAWSQGYQIEMTPSTHRIASKWPGINSGGINYLTLTGGPFGVATTTAGSGTPAWSGGAMTANGTSVYVITAELINNSDGTVTLNLYHAPLASASTPVLDNSAVITSTQKATITSGGNYGMMFLGNQSVTAVSIGYKIPTGSYPMTLTPTVAGGQ